MFQNRVYVMAKLALPCGTGYHRHPLVVNENKVTYVFRAILFFYSDQYFATFE